MSALVKDEAYHKRQEAFLAKILKLHQMNGNPIKRLPLLGGRELDLYHLYVKVQLLGGSEKVTRERMWGEVSRSFNLPSSVTSASYACRQNFIKFLEQYEKLENSGTPFDPASYVPPVSPYVPSSQKINTRSYTLATPTIPTHQSSLPSTSLPLDQLQLLRRAGLPGLIQLTPTQLSQLQLLLHQPGSLSRLQQPAHKVRYDWLLRSLTSGLPNEVDFSLNALLMVSHDQHVILTLTNVPQLLDVLLAHVAVFPIDDSTGYEQLYREVWHEDGDKDYMMFWESVVPDWVWLSLFPYLTQGSAHSQLFPHWSTVSDDRTECCHVTQIVNILRNLSFEDSNSQYLARQEHLIRFLCLAVNCVVPSVSTAALDIVANITPHLLLSNELDHPTHLLLLSLHHCILSSDRHAILRGLEALGGLAWCFHNESPLSATTPREIYQRMVDLLLVADCQLVLMSLDSLYNLSFLGREIGAAILTTRHCVEVLLFLLKFNVDQLPAAAIEGVVLVFPNGKTEVPTLSTKVDQKKAVEPVPRPPSSSSPSTPQLAGGTPLRHTKPSPLNLLTDRSAISQLSSITRNHTIVPQKKQNQELLAIEWLHSQYVATVNDYVPRLELFTRYLTRCSQLGRGAIMTQNEFDQLVRKVFPNSFLTEVKVGGHDIVLVGGISRRKPNLPSSTTTLTSSAPDGSLKPSTLSSPSLHTTTTTSSSLSSHLASKTAVPSSRATSPSPLLLSSRMSQQNQSSATPPLCTSASCEIPAVNTVTRQNQTVSTLQPAISNTTSFKQSSTSTTSSSSLASSSSSTFSSASSSNSSLSQQSTNSGHSLAPSRHTSTVTNTMSNSLRDKKEVTDFVSGKDHPVISGNGDLKVSPREPNLCLMNGDTDMLTAGKKRKIDELQSELDEKQLSKRVHIDEIEESLSTTSSNGSSSLVNEQLNTKLPFVSSTSSPSVSSTDNTQIAKRLSQSQLDCQSSTLSSVRSPSSLSRSVSPSVTRDSTPESLHPALPYSPSQPPSSQSHSSHSHSTVTTSATNPHLPSSKTSISLTPHRAPDGVTGLSNTSGRSSSPLSNISSSSSLDLTKLVCSWDNCQQVQSSWQELFHHVVYDHLPLISSYPCTCMWTSCTSKIRRMRPSLVIHLQTHHCSPGPKPTPPNVPNTLLRLKAMDPYESEEETHITKPIRLTAGLVLRNLLRTLPEAKRYLKAHEFTLAQVAFSSSEASSAAAQCLAYLTSSSLTSSLSHSS